MGIKDPYELNEEQCKAVLSLLREQRKIVNRYRHDAFIQIDDFTNEGTQDIEIIPGKSSGFDE